MSLIKKFNVVVKDEELFLKQRAKFTWLSEGDHNTKYFHRALKERINNCRIEAIEDLEGNLFSGDVVGNQFVKHFEKVLGSRGLVIPIFI